MNINNWLPECEPYVEYAVRNNILNQNNAEKNANHHACVKAGMVVFCPKTSFAVYYRKMVKLFVDIHRHYEKQPYLK